jgi:hypothetical protein
MVGLDFRRTEFPGWPATDLAGTALGDDRRDWVLSPSLSVEYVHPFETFDLKVGAGYGFVRQWSNSADYDTEAHTVVLELGIEH